MKKQKLKKTLNKNLIFIGLGNPGDKYRETRHNAGFAVIDLISEKYGITFKKAFLRPVLTGKFIYNNSIIHLVKPLTFMNHSGIILKYVMRKTRASIRDIVLICDNMDLSPGMVRIKKKGSSAGHNGIKSVIDNLGTPDFTRMYIGVGRSKTGESVVEHVLGPFDAEDKNAFNKAVDTASEALLSLADNDLGMVMNGINKKDN